VTVLQIERALNQEITTRLRAECWPVIALPVPNGIWLPAQSEAERTLVARIVKRMKDTGMLLPGAPDLVIVWRDGALLCELKTAAGRPSAEQRDMARVAGLLGIRYAIVRSWEQLAALLRSYGLRPHFDGWPEAAE
jgi:hypothetical protein